MTRRHLLKATLAGVAFLALPKSLVAQSASVTEDVLMMARREFYAVIHDIRADVYWFGSEDGAARGFEDFCEWASKDQDEDDLEIHDVEDVTHEDRGSFGNRPPTNYPMSLQDGPHSVRWFAGQVGTGWDHASTMVMHRGYVVHVWRLISESRDLLWREANDFFTSPPVSRREYTAEQLLRSLPTIEDLTHIDNAESRGEMTLEEVIDFR